MNKVYGKSDLQEILDLYANQDSRDEAIARAEQLLKDFANEDVDIEQLALEEFPWQTSGKDLELFWPRAWVQSLIGEM